jgi:hypothetical protein
VLDSDFVQITIFALEQEEECSLKENGLTQKRITRPNCTNLHFMHDRCSDNQTPTRILQRMFSTRYWNSVLRNVHMTVYYMVFTTDEYT